MSIDPEVYSEFERHMQDLGVRRDAYLNKFLGGELAVLRELPANSGRASQLWKAMRRAQGGQLRKVSLRLAASLVAQINEVCGEKGVPRDLFFEQFLRYANDSLGKALVYFENPSSAEGWSNEQNRPYAGLILSDGDVRRVLDAVQERGEGSSRGRK